uniref:Uncharacterized protein n=1 Tax=Anguilla anguilla TaxID=7936 RepID=A0A0E9V8Q9_ANGAN
MRETRAHCVVCETASGAFSAAFSPGRS